MIKEKKYIVYSLICAPGVFSPNFLRVGYNLKRELKYAENETEIKQPKTKESDKRKSLEANLNS